METFQLVDDPAPAIDISTAVITPDTCSQNIGSITGITVQGTPSFTFAWYDASGASIAATKDISSLGQGNYYLMIDDQNNCSTTGPTDPDNRLAGSTPSPAQTNSTGDFTTAPLDADTTFYVVLRKGDCSSAAAAVNIKVLATQELIVPNAFTPNGDGHNDLFRVKNPQLVQSLSMMIFDRWGVKVFESADPYKGWDGSWGGHPASGGTYIWTIHYTDIEGNSKYRRGTLILVR